MKTNAIIRIIIYTVVVALLSTLLAAGICNDFLSSRHTAKSTGPIATDDSGSNGVVSTENIRQLEIEWVAGTITILPGTQTDTIRFRDDYSGDEKYLLSYSVSEGELRIQFCKEDWDDISFGIPFRGPLEKNLTVEIPQGWLCDSLEIEAASARLEVRDLTFNEAEIDTASGDVTFENCSVDSLSLDSASGDVAFSGALHNLECDSASASVVLQLDNVPRNLELDTASGNLDIALPENAGFTVSMNTMSGKFRSDFGYQEHNGSYTCGDGACRIQVNAMSGNVNIRKNAN